MPSKPVLTNIKAANTMGTNRVCLAGLLLWFSVVCAVCAQDTLPVRSRPQFVVQPEMRPTPDRTGLFSDMQRFRLRTDSSAFLSRLLPEVFADVRPNLIERPEELMPFFRKLKAGETPVRVVHLGDSHVRGHVFPRETRRMLEAAWGGEAVFHDSITYRTSALARETGKPGLVYHAIGINGAHYCNFDTEAFLLQVSRLHPDLIILSFGTNEAHGARYQEDWHRAEMDALVTHLRERSPQAQILLTTPPGAYKTTRQRRRNTTGRSRYVTLRTENKNTPQVVKVQTDYARRHNLPLWNLYEIAGGVRSACSNWRNYGLINKDLIHFTPQGYTLQGKLLAEALLNAYENVE